MLLAFDDVGPGPVVVLLHGFPLDRSMWEFQLAEVGSIYRVIAPDLRGSGSTAAPDGIYTVDLMADDVIDTLDALELDDPVVIGGLSMGGYSIVKRGQAVTRPTGVPRPKAPGHIAGRRSKGRADDGAANRRYGRPHRSAPGKWDRPSSAARLSSRADMLARYG